MFKNIMKVLFSNIVLTLTGLVNSLVFPALLSVEQYAYYQKYLLYISYANICHLGIASGMFLNYAGKKYIDTDKFQYKSEIYLIYIILCVFTIIGLFIYPIFHSKLFLYVVLTIFPLCIIASFQALYMAWERFTAYSVINALPKILFTLIFLLDYLIVKNISSNFIVILYLIIQWIICLYFLIEFFVFTKGVKSLPVFSVKNLKTAFDGFMITLGNYINLLFHCVDKQFVNILYSNFAFSIYSFAMSMQCIMLIFITALGNPFYPRLAKSDITDKFINDIKEMLFMFGAYSGCAYFLISFFIKHFIPKYIASIDIVFIFFLVFPALSVINILYVNLYKINRMLKKYILTLVLMIIISICLNFVSVLLNGNYIGISIATVLSYYIWLIYSQFDFKSVNITLLDYIYLCGFIVIYTLSKYITNDIMGCMIYGIVITGWNYFMYKNSVRYFAENIINKTIKSKIYG